MFDIISTVMAKNTEWKCSSCGVAQIKWLGQCPQCKEWGTLEETAVTVRATSKSSFGSTAKGYRAGKVATGNRALPVNQIARETTTTTRTRTGINEFDRVLGEGLVPGGVILLAGPPGTGKSSLALWVASVLANAGKKALYITGEETAHQVASRALRIGATSTENDSKLGENLLLLSEGNLQNSIQQLIDTQPDFLVIDSIQTLLSEDSESRIGSVTQATEVATEFTNLAKQLNIPTILIGHMTKDNNTIAGANAVQHLVDVVLVFESSQDSPLRLLRASKNRYGSTDEIGVFIHTETGLEEVPDPSNLFMDEHAEGVSGFAITITSEGRRMFPVEVQALVSATKLPNPRKLTQGVEHSRSLQIQAVIEKTGLGIRLFDQDVYVSSVGGIKLQDPGTDLAVVAALISSKQNIPLSTSYCFIGEVTLTGEVRSARDRDRKVKEASRLFDVVFTTPGKTFPGTKIVQVKTVYDLAVHMKKIGEKGIKHETLFEEEPPVTSVENK